VMERKKEEVKCPRSLAASAVNTNATQKKRKEKQKKKTCYINLRRFPDAKLEKSFSRSSIAGCILT
jgi:hypothetical protein